MHTDANDCEANDVFLIVDKKYKTENEGKEEGYHNGMGNGSMELNSEFNTQQNRSNIDVR